MITVADLKTQTVKDLSAMARKMGVTGVHAMRKDQLVRAVAKAVRAKQSSSRQRSSTSRSKSKPKDTSAQRVRAGKSGGRSSRETSTAKAKSERVLRKIRKVNAKREQLKDLSHASQLAAGNGRKKKKLAKKPKRPFLPAPGKDRIALLVRDPYWLQACWDVTRQSVERAKAAMSEHWHTAEPVLRLLHVDSGPTTSTTERVVREIPIHGGVKNWYIDIKDSPNSYRVDLGYLAENGKFYVLARSNVVTTPRPGSSDAIDENWSDIAEDYEKIFAMSGGYELASAGGDLQELFEEQLRRPMGNPVVCHFGAEQALRRDHDFHFTVDAELIIFGATKPNAHVTLRGEPVRLRPDGSFTVRLSLPDRRQVLPVVACSRDGVEQRTIVLAVERNTKVMEPKIRDPNE